MRLRVRYENLGTAPLALTFWWNRTLRVTDDHGRACAPTTGPELPCGAGEMWTVLAPGEVVEHEQPLACTQPAGRSERIGWRYQLDPGVWRATLVHEAPPAHGFTQSKPHPAAFSGRVESNEVSFVVKARPQGVLARLLRILARR